MIHYSRGAVDVMQVAIKKLKPSAVVPSYGSLYSAGADLYACVESGIDILPGETVFVPTGVALEIPIGFAGFVFARSGLSCKRGLAPANKVGVIDSDYRGEIGVIMINLGSEDFTVNDGERICQMVIKEYVRAEWETVDRLDETKRGDGGFGHTGVD